MTKKYNEIEVKDNMKVNNAHEEEVATTVEKKELSSVVSAKPTKVKRSLIGRLVTGIVGPDGLPGIGAYVNDEIVKPAIKNIIVDAVTSGINMVMYGDRAPHRSGHRPHVGGRSQYTPRTNYGGIHRSADREPERVVSRSPRAGVEEYIIGDRFEAAEVLVSLTEAAERYGSVSVADYYDVIGINPKFTDYDHGWVYDTIARASVIPVRNGYVIKFPPVEVI